MDKPADGGTDGLATEETDDSRNGRTERQNVRGTDGTTKCPRDGRNDRIPGQTERQNARRTGHSFRDPKMRLTRPSGQRCVLMYFSLFFTFHGFLIFSVHTIHNCGHFSQKHYIRTDGLIDGPTGNPFIISPLFPDA